MSQTKILQPDQQNREHGRKEASALREEFGPSTAPSSPPSIPRSYASMFYDHDRQSKLRDNERLREQVAAECERARRLEAESATWEPCPNCAGTGSLYRPNRVYVRCPACDARGRIAPTVKP